MGESRLPESSVGILIGADRLSGCAPQHNLSWDWLGLARWMLQMGSSSSSCHQEDNILLSNYKHAKRSSEEEEQDTAGRRRDWNECCLQSKITMNIPGERRGGDNYDNIP